MAPVQGVALVAAVAAVVVGGYQLAAVRSALEDLRAEAKGVQQQLKLLRIERRSKAGVGMVALLERLEFWAPKLGRADTIEAPEIRKRVEEIIDAMSALEPADTFAALERKFMARHTERELARWLLDAMIAVDSTRGASLLARIIDLEVVTKPGVRLQAAHQLVKLDRERAAPLLRKIMRRESHQGANRDRLPVSDYEKYAKVYRETGTYPGFFNYVHAYVESGDAEIDATLLMVLGRQEHDLATMQACVKELGARKSRMALDKIKSMFTTPPKPHTHSIFRRHCIQAVADIAGSEACPWLQEVLRREKDPILALALRELIKELC